MTAHTAAQAAYVVAALLFILSLAGLSRHETSRAGIVFGMAGMAIALAATVLLAGRSGTAATGLALIAAAVVVGAAVGLWRARVVQMTGMPELGGQGDNGDDFPSLPAAPSKKKHKKKRKKHRR